MAEEHGLAAFRWILGDWQRESATRTVVERWREVSDVTFEGISFTIADGDTVVSEHLRLERFDDDIFYTAKPKGASFPTPFKLIHSDDTMAEFENPTHDFPTRIVYQREGDHLNAWIEGPSEDGTRRIEFPYELKTD